MTEVQDNRSPQLIHTGASRVARLCGVDFFVHWSFVIGGVITGAYAGGDIPSMLYCAFAMFALVLTHELGHAAALHFMNLRVFAIEVGLYGRCWGEPPKSVAGAFFLFTAGFAAQLLMFGATFLYVSWHGWPRNVVGRSFVGVFLIANIVILVLNLLPSRSRSGMESDGRVLLRLLAHVLFGKPYPLPWNTSGPSPILDIDVPLLERPSLVPDGFTVGVEIYNDDVTPMDFVAAVLKRHLCFDEAVATALMLSIHRCGGALVALPSYEEAERVAAGIAADNEASGHRLLCRPVRGGGSGAR